MKTRSFSRATVRGKRRRFYKIALDGGEADLAYTFPIPVSQVFPLKNGDLLVVGSTFPGFEDLYKGDKKLVKAYFDDK